MGDTEKFETKLARLEELNENIQSGEMELGEAIDSFEEGMKLAASLENELAQIERRVEILTSGADEAPTFKDF